VADTDGDRTGGLDCVGGEDRAASASRDARKRGEGTDGDENRREGGHRLGVLGREEVERVAGIEQPDRRLCNRRGDWDRGTLGCYEMNRLGMGIGIHAPSP
jgi:hypothetical protein